MRRGTKSAPDVHAVEVGTTLVLGRDDGANLVLGPGRRGVQRRPGAARAALETIVLEALRRSPCLVSFSGGRDSSAVLAVATHVARREGLPLPVPMTLAFPDCADSDETEWQRLVVEHLDLPEWERRTLHDEMDVVGPIAAPILRRHGWLWPFNTHFHQPIFEAAAGGTVLSGAFGDEMMGAGWTWRRENLVCQRRRAVRPADPARAAIAALGPAPVRRWFLRARSRASGDPGPVQPPWMTEHAFRGVEAAILDLDTQQSLSYARTIGRGLWPMRYRTLGLASLTLLAAETDTRHQAPFADERFAAGLVQERRWRMYESRTEAMTVLAGDLLPSAINSRWSKASFDTAFFNVHARTFAREWDGSGLDPTFVDVEELRRTWCEDNEPDARTYALLQQAWLHSQGGGRA